MQNDYVQIGRKGGATDIDFRIGVENRDYHHLSQFEIDGGKRISQHLSQLKRQARIPHPLLVALKSLWSVGFVVMLLLTIDGTELSPYRRAVMFAFERTKGVQNT